MGSRTCSHGQHTMRISCSSLCIDTPLIRVACQQSFGNFFVPCRNISLRLPLRAGCRVHVHAQRVRFTFLDTSSLCGIHPSEQQLEQYTEIATTAGRQVTTLVAVPTLRVRPPRCREEEHPHDAPVALLWYWTGAERLREASRPAVQRLRTAARDR